MDTRRKSNTGDNVPSQENTATRLSAMTANDDDDDGRQSHCLPMSRHEIRSNQTTASTPPPLQGLGSAGYQVHPCPGITQATATTAAPSALFPLPISVPPAVQNSVTSLQYLEVVAHPKFEDIMRAIFIGRQIGEDPDRQRLIADQHKRSMDGIHRARIELQKQRQRNDSESSGNADLDVLLNSYLKLVQGLNQELILTQSEANNACSMFEQQIRAITNSASQMEGPVALSATDEDHLRQVLKRKYSNQIKHLSEEFSRKRKKGKLPVNATDVLRSWWDNNLAWPYPSEDEKRDLAGQTDLNPTQINNWFINQRKRHWHKFFKDGRLPQSPEEAVDILKQQGIIP